MKFKILLSFAFVFFQFSVLSHAQVQLNDWTNKAGRTIKAKFIRADANTVTIFLNGRNFVLKVADLDKESQALARKLSGSSSPTPPPIASAEEKATSSSVTEKPSIGGKLLLPTLGSGKWAQFNSVLETATHDVALHGSGMFHLYLKDGSQRLLGGRPIQLQFNHGYYTKPHPKGSNYAYHVSRTDHHYHYRKITAFENPPAPSEKLGRLKLLAKLEGGVEMEINFEASSRRVAIWGKAKDPSGTDYPTIIALRLTMPESISVKDGEGLADWEPLVEDTAIEVVTASRAKERIPYLEKWVDLKKKLTFEKGIESALTSGKLLGRRKMEVSSKSLRNSALKVGSYSGVFPFQFHRYYYQHSQGGEIDKGSCLEIEIK